MYRKLWLTNNNNETFEFTNKNSKYFLSSIGGMGLAKTLTGYNLGNVSKTLTSNYDFLTITGELMFYDKVNNAYEDYFSFIKFCGKTPLRLYYLPPNTLNAYYVECDVISVAKNEYGTDNIMRCSVSIQPFTHWLTSNEVVVSVDSGVGNGGKNYPLTRPYYYEGTSYSNITLTNEGSNDVGIVVEITGSVTNPTWTLTQDGIVYGTCKINGTYDFVKVNSVDGQQLIYLELNGSAIANPSAYQDLSISGGMLTFIKLKTGTSTMVFTSGGAFSGNVKIRYNQSYVSV